MNTIVSKKEIEGKQVFRIHHIVDEKLAGLEAVEKTKAGEFKKIYNWNDGGELEDYMNELEDIKAVSELESKQVMKFLESFSTIGRDELSAFLKESDSLLELTFFISSPNGFYAFTKHADYGDLEGGTFYRAYSVLLDRTGHFRRLNPLEAQGDIELAVTHMSLQLADGERAFFQFRPNVTCGVKRIQDRIQFLFLEERENENGEGEIITSADSVYVLVHDAETNQFTSPEEAWSEEDRGAFIMDMMPVFTQTTPENIIKNTTQEK